MEQGSDPNYDAALPDVSPAVLHQQGMSPTHAHAAAADDAQEHAGDTTMVAGGQGAAQAQEAGIAVRAMAVALATGQSPGRASWPMEGQQGSVEESRRSHTEVMGYDGNKTDGSSIQRLGAFFQEVRAQQPAPMWNPSPLGSPPSGGRAMGSPESEQGVWMNQTHSDRPLLSRGQREQLQRMEQRAPLLYGQQQRGSTYEAVQLRGVVEQLEASRQEASELRREMERLQVTRELEDQRPEQVSCRKDCHNGETSRIFYAKGIGLIGKDLYVVGDSNVCRTFYQRGLGLTIGNYHNKCTSIAYRIFYGRGIGLTVGYYHNGYPTVAYRIFYHRGIGLANNASSATTNATSALPIGLSATPPGSSDPMSRLLEGLEKVIKGGGKQEELSKVVEGPKLPEISDSSSVDFGDWLYCLEHTMGDISASSAEWWKLVVKDAQEYYDKYREADQYARLSMKPKPSSGLEEAKWTRVDRRGASVLLGAVPEDVKKELIASRARSTLDVWAGSLDGVVPIETPEPGATTQRAKDLKLSIPDPSILVKALDGMLKKPVADHSDVGFRMNLLHLKVDFLPSEDNVLAIHRAFLAEFEQMGYKKNAKQGMDPTPAPRLRAMENEQPQLPTSPTKDGKGGAKPCRFYLSDEGCRRGKGCRFEHTMKDLSKAERRDRCYECGAKGHLSASCPTRKELQQKAMGVGDSPQSSTGGTSGRRGGGSPKGPKGGGSEETEPVNVVPAEVPTTAASTAAGLQAWVNEVSTEDMEEPLVLRVDNTAACGLATTSPGSWKTRHLKVKARHLRMEISEGRIQVIHTPGEVQVADMGTKPVPVARLVELRRLWGMCTADEFEKKDQEVIIKSLQGPEYYDMLRLLVWLMLMNSVPTTEAAEIYNKKPLDYDGSFEFYGLLLIGGVALLGIWETVKWVAHKLFGDDEVTLAKARRLMRIRNQASKALQEELASMSASSSDPMFEEKPKATVPSGKEAPVEPLGVGATFSTAPTTPATSSAAPSTPATYSAAATTRAEDDPDLRATLEHAQNGQYRRLRKSFVMSEHGDRLHAVPNCHGLRHANKSKLKQMQVCYYCDGNFPLYYKVTHGQVLPEG
ncbi:PIP5K4 [Symbiodinium sp. CCMP2592]|nr:PIP5K4 [Symbiodinium sp. CCMP2592]